MNQSFAAVGAFTTGEVNLTAGDRPLRVRTALVDEHLFAALGVPAAQGRLFAKGETDVTGPPPAPGQPAPQTAERRDPLARVVADRVRRTADRRRDHRGQWPASRSHWHPAARRRRHGQPHRDLAAARAEPGQSSESRQPLPLSHRPAEGRCHAAGGSDRAGRAHRELGRARRARRTGRLSFP